MTITVGKRDSGWYAHRAEPMDLYLHPDGMWRTYCGARDNADQSDGYFKDFDVFRRMLVAAVKELQRQIGRVEVKLTDPSVKWGAP